MTETTRVRSWAIEATYEFLGTTVHIASSDWRIGTWSTGCSPTSVFPPQMLLQPRW